MTGENSSAHNDKTNETFDALMSGNWEREPNPQEMMDAGVRRLFDDAKSLEDSLNAVAEVTEDIIQELLIEINGDWGQLGYERETFHITGRLRPTNHAIEEDVEELVRQDAFIGLGERQHDVRGDYYPAAHMGLQVRGFDVETISLGKNKQVYRTVVKLGLDEDYSDDESWFTAYPEELEYIETPYPSSEGAAEFIRQYFPELFALIQALPESCGDPELIRNALDDFVVTIDLTKTHSTLGTEEILELIETYITDRLSFDSASHKVGIRGLIYGRNMNYQAVVTDYQGELDELLIGSVRLYPTNDITEASTLITYRPMLETWYLVPEMNGGRTLINIPIDSVTKITSNRPSLHVYPFDNDTLIMPNERFDSEFQVSPLQASLGESALQLAGIDTESDQLDDEYEDYEELPRTEILELYQHELIELHGTIKPLVMNSVRYDTLQEMVIARDDVTELIQEFMARWQAILLTAKIEVMGESILIPDTTITRSGDGEEQWAKLDFTGMSLIDTDILTARRGVLIGSHVDGGRARDERGGYALRAVLTMVDASSFTPDIVINEPNMGIPMVIAQTSKRFFVNLAGEVQYSMTELNRDTSRREAMKSLDALPIQTETRTKIIDQLETLADAFDNEDFSEFVEYRNVAELRDMALAVAGDEDASLALADIIQRIVGVPRTIKIDGHVVEGTGDYEKTNGLVASLYGVISTHPWLKSHEPAFMLSVPALDKGEKEQFILAPLSTLDKLSF